MLQRVWIILKKYFKQKLFRIKFPTKNLVDAYLYLPPGMELWAPKIAIFEMVQNLFSHKKLSGHIYLSQELSKEVPKICH